MNAWVNECNNSLRDPAKLFDSAVHLILRLTN